MDDDRPGSLARSRAGLRVLALGLTTMLANCTTGAQTAGSAAPKGPVTYRCEDDMQMTVERRGTLVSVHSPRGLDLDLPAAPPGQDARFGEALYAVVLDDRDALWMVNGKAPISCTQ